MSQAFDLAKFVSERKDIVDRLYAEADVEIKSFDDLLKLPVNDEYAKNQLRKQKTEDNLKSLDNTKEGDNGPK
jgi:hypothetical protein